MKKRPVSAYLILLGALFALSPWSNSAIALALGVILALLFGNPYTVQTKKMTPRLLAISIVGLGAGMNLGVVGKVGIQGIGYTMIGILSVAALGTYLGRLFGTEKNTSTLITVGTAICGGSAIAAVSPVIEAKPDEVTVSLGIVFMLNACALMLFPLIGHLLHLDETQFGLWSALAIHDTSSVVGATLQYGPHALEVGTTVKLARALWIIPVTLAIAYLNRKSRSSQADPAKVKRPWFILGFLVAAALVTFIPELTAFGHQMEALAKKLMVLTLFLIGANITRGTLKAVGLRPFAQGAILWFITASASLAAIYAGWVH